MLKKRVSQLKLRKIDRFIKQVNFTMKAQLTVSDLILNSKKAYEQNNQMKKQSKLTFLLIVLLLVYTNQQCSQTATTADLLQTGSSIISNSYSNSQSKREHLYQFSVNYAVPPTGFQIAASASNFNAYSSSGLDFSIRGKAGPGSTTGVIVLLINEDNSWSSIKVNYIVSSRSDMFLGTFSADIYLLQKYSSGSISISYAIPNWSLPAGSYSAVGQIAGVRSSAPSIILMLNSVSFNSGVIQVSLTASSTPAIENIFITYILLQSNSPVQLSTFNINSGSSATYQFIGIDQFNNGNTVLSGSSFIIQTSSSTSSSSVVCVGPNCPTQCISFQNCIGYGGQLTSTTCYLCNQGQTVVNGNCQTTSTNNCGPNQSFDGAQCSCNSGYVSVSGTCYQMCGQYAYLLNSQCICQPGYSYSYSQGQCSNQQTPVSTCGTNFILSNNKCICPNGYGLVKTLCVVCPSNSYVDGNGQCTCNNGYALNSASLTCSLACFDNAYRNSLGQCVCNDGYFNQGNQCVSQGNCQNGMTWNGTACSCPSAQFPDSITKLCTLCNTPDRAVIGTSCGCSPTYYPSNGACIPCNSYSIYNSASQQCVCMSGYSLSNGQCVLNTNCPANANWNSVYKICQCIYSGQYIINGVCQSCPQYSTWNGNNCICQNGYVMIGSSCNGNCPAYSSWNGQSCICNNGYFMIGTSCATCDINSVYVPSKLTCVCNSGWYGSYNACFRCSTLCTTCYGPNSNQCLTCSGSNILSAGSCSSTCGVGMYSDPNNNCAPCMAFCDLCYSSSSCATCSQGYSTNLVAIGSTITMSCILTPTGTSSTLTLNGKTIGNNVVYQGVSLKVVPTSLLASNCAACNDLLLVQIVSAYSSVTSSVTYVKNSLYWFLITFNFGSVAFVPSFQFTVQINPAYASSFSAADMAQQLTGTISATNPYGYSSQIYNKPSNTNTAIFTTTAKSSSSSTSLDNVNLSSIFSVTA